MKDRLTRTLNPSYSISMPESESRDIDIEKPEIKEKALEQKQAHTEAGVVKEHEKEASKLNQELSEEIENQDPELDNLISDVPEPEKPFYKGMWMSLKNAFSQDQSTDLEYEDESAYKKRVYSLRRVVDLPSLKSYTKPGSELYNRYTNIFKNYAKTFEGSYKNEFGDDNFKGSASEFLLKAKEKYLVTVKNIIEKAKKNQDFSVAQTELSNLEDDLTTRKLQIEQVASQEADLADQIKNQEPKEEKDDKIVAQWPVAKFDKLSIETEENHLPKDSTESSSIKTENPQEQKNSELFPKLAHDDDPEVVEFMWRMYTRSNEFSPQIQEFIKQGLYPPIAGGSLDESEIDPLERLEEQSRDVERRVDEQVDNRRQQIRERDREFKENMSNKDIEFPKDGDSWRDHLRQISLHTGISAEELRNIGNKLETIIELNLEQWKVLMRCEGVFPGYIRMLYESMSRIDMSLEDVKEEARKQTEILQKQTYTRTIKENVLGRIENTTSRDEIINMVGKGGIFSEYYSKIMSNYREVLEGEYEDNFLGSGIKKTSSKKDFEAMQQDYYVNTIMPQFQRLVDEMRDVEELKQFVKDKVDEFADIHFKVENSARGKERQNRQIQNIEQLAQAIMDTHPEFAQGTDKALIDDEGNFSEENFMNWIHSQLQYYHDQDPDNPQTNFMASINIDVPELIRTVNILTMINNPGLYFRNKDGVRLKKLEQEVTFATWLWGDIRNKDIAYRLIMPMDEKVGEALMNMYQNNVLTKMTGDGTPPIQWILSQAEKFGGGDKKIGMGILESLMIYYNLTDFPELYNKYAGHDSPLFNLNEIEKTIQSLITKGNMRENDSYLSAEQWAELRSFFNEDGSLKILDNTSDQINFVKFFNIYAPEQDPRIITLVRELIKNTVQKNMDLSDENVVYAEQFAQFFLRFTLAAARADLGAPAMDAGEKVMRLYLHEKGPNATNPGYGNIKAVALRRALGLDFFAGTYVLTNEYKNVPLKRVKDAPYLTTNAGNRMLEGDEEVITLSPQDVVQTDGSGKKWLLRGKENRRKFFEDLPREIRVQNSNDDKYLDAQLIKKAEVQHIGDNVIVTAEGLHFDLEEEKQKLINLYGLNSEEYEVIPEISEDYIAGERGLYNVSIKLIIRKWNTKEYTKAADYKRAIVRRNRDGSVEVTHEIASNEDVVVDIDDKGKPVKLNRKELQQIVFVDKLLFEEKKYDKVAKKMTVLQRQISLDHDEYYDTSTRTIRKFPSGEVVRSFDDENRPRYAGREKYLVKQETRAKSTLSVMQDMHVAAQKYKDAQSDQAKEQIFEDYGEVASQLAYKTDTMRQYSSNHLGRIFQMFHEGLDKHIMDPAEIIQGWDEKKNRWVFNETKIQDIFTEQLYKRRRYAYRTYGIYMGEMIRGIALHDPEQFEDMTVAEHLFGREVLNQFRQRNGEIDFEYLSTPEGIGNLFKTELLMRLAAEEAQFSDKNYPEKGMALHLKLAYREALRRAIASGQYLDEDDPEASRFHMDTFEGRKICFDEEENKHIKDFMDIYSDFVGASDAKLILRQGRWEIGHETLPGIWDAFKKFVGETVKG